MNRVPLLLSLLLSFFLHAFFNSLALAASAQFGLSPDNAQPVLVKAIQSAQQELLINIYQFENDSIKDAVVQKIKERVPVKILIEGEPVGGISGNGEQTLLELLNTMKASGHPDSNIYMMKKSPSGKRRFAFDHAKYMIIDHTRVFLSSENFSNGAHPTPGLTGNRGWHVVVEDAPLAQSLLALFSTDSDPSQDDIVDLRKKGMPITGKPVTAAKPTQRTIPPIAERNGWVDSAELISSPHSESDLAALASGATQKVDLQFMSLPYTWNDQNQSQTNPLVQGLIDAARSGAKVRALLNDETVFSSSPVTPDPPKLFDTLTSGGFLKLFTLGSYSSKKNKNLQTVCKLRAIAQKEGLQLNGRIVSVKNVQISYIHNKGMLVDGNKTLISSINGTRNSMLNNRETAVVLHGTDANSYFSQAFEFDWQSSNDPSSKDCASARFLP